MIEPVNPQDFTSQPERRKPEQFEHVKFRIDGGVARMTLNRPDHNLLNEAMLREIAGGITHAGESDGVKLIVLDSACKVFCGGIDIGEYTSQRVFQMLDAFHGAFSGMLEVGKPVVCVVNGPAIGGGAELAAFGDLVIATPRRVLLSRKSVSAFSLRLPPRFCHFLSDPKSLSSLFSQASPLHDIKIQVRGIAARDRRRFGPRSRHCDRLKSRKPGHPLMPQRSVLFARKSAAARPQVSRGAFLLSSGLCFWRDS